MITNNNDEDHLNDEFAAATWRKRSKSEKPNNAYTTENLDNNHIDNGSEVLIKNQSKKTGEHTSKEFRDYRKKLLDNKGLIVLALVGGITVAIVKNSFVHIELFPQIKFQISPSPSPKVETKSTS